VPEAEDEEDDDDEDDGERKTVGAGSRAIMPFSRRLPDERH
jgi:hypothetical protein